MPGRITPIIIEKAVEKYSIPYQTLHGLVKAGKIAAIRRGSTYIVDENSIQAYFDLKKKVEKLDRYREQLLQEKQEEIDDIISQYDDYLFSMRTLNKTTRLFKVLVRELARVIRNDRERKIFIDVSIGQSIYNVACKQTLSYDKVCDIYARAVDQVAKKNGIIMKYRKTSAKLLFELHRKNIEIKNLQDYIERMERFKGFEKAEINPLPDKVVNLLILSLEELTLTVRTANILRIANILTVEDILRYLAKHGGAFESFLAIENFGNACLKDLKQKLQQFNIIDCNEYSYLLQYVSI